MKNCLIFLEQGNEKYAVGLLKAAEEIYGGVFHSIALSVHAEITAAVGCFDEILEVCDERVREYDPAQLTDLVEELMPQYEFHSILIPATYLGRMLAPRIARRLDTGLVADVTEIRHRDGRLVMVRPAFSGKIMAAITNESTLPVMMSVRPGVFEYGNTEKKHTVIREYHPRKIRSSGLSLVSRVEKPDSRDIRDSRVLVSVGGGAMNAPEAAAHLAELLGGMVSASRRAVDSGKADRSIQVGQSGKVVSPELYLAAGIYGSIQHIAGLRKVRHLIAVNTDPKAPLCTLADLVVEGDAEDFMKKLAERIESH